MSRAAQLERHTAETQIELALDLDGSGQAHVNTGVGFFDHMLTLLAKHSLIDLQIKAKGDLHVEAHHTVEDVGICLGKALSEALATKAGIRRYGDCVLPMDETLITAAVDVGGRPYFAWKAEVPRKLLGTFNSHLAEEFWQAVTSNALMNLHVICHYGRNTHHIIEAIFKGVAPRCGRQWRWIRTRPASCRRRRGRSIREDPIDRILIPVIPVTPNDYLCKLHASEQRLMRTITRNGADEGS